MKFKIGNVEFGGNKTIVIAEAGVNHLGRLDYAEKLIKSAKIAGADIIKFQTYKASKLTTKKAPRFWSWEGERDKNGSQYDSYSILDKFGEDQYSELIRICKDYKIEFMSTPFDTESALMLVKLGMKGFKIASCDITNLPLLEKIGEFRLPVLLSTGAANIFEIEKAVETLEKKNCKQIGIMQCTLCYPTKPQDANLLAIKTLDNHFKNYLIGFSDHTLGNVIPSASILMGVKFIEKHFTFDKSLPDSADHWLSLDEQELKEMVKNLRTLEEAIGSPVKEKKNCEDLTFKYARRSLVANTNISKGERIKKKHITAKRPGTGLSPVSIDLLIGKVANRDIQEDTILEIDWFY
jgi:sialic acid synthase SpsE